jgi:fatty-acyl-CoA synthase
MRPKRPRNNEVSLDTEQSLAFLRQRWASYKVQRHVLFFGKDEVAVTGNAKTKIGALQETSR